jgi:hypothetical protein
MGEVNPGVGETLKFGQPNKLRRRPQLPFRLFHVARLQFKLTWVR